AEFATAFDRIRRILESEGGSDEIQVESYIPGREFALEGLVVGGRLLVLALFDKPDPLEGPFFEETIYVTPSREPVEVQDAIQSTTQRAVSALGLTDGPVHAEMRVNGRGVYMLEVAARPIGGLCAQALRFAGGMSFEELLLRFAVGEDVTGIKREAAASGVMMVPIPASGIYRSVEGVEDARAVPHVTDVVITAKEGQRLLQLPEGSSYLGFLFARAELPEQVEAALRRAHSKLRFQIATELPALRPGV
ncbi:MAG: ATP-grasp domain-containing protein, partial [Acidobacteriaceae bacterium]|nr:ATP-grasp domain-containing protein [Acidobacteriaceae bacterium]